MSVQDFLDFLAKERCTAILRTPDEAKAAPAMQAALDGGFRVCEFTLTIPGAFDRIAEFSKKEGVVVGAGTVLSVEDARRAVDSGASFLVSPVIDPLVVEEANRLGVASIPGCYTPTEMWRAHHAGAPLVKLFPAPGIGSTFIKATLGPMPFLRIVPTAGVDEENCLEFLAAGAYGIGFVASLFDPADMAEGNWEAIRSRAERITTKIRG